MRSTRDLVSAEIFLSGDDGPRSVSFSSSSGRWLVPVDDRKAAMAGLEIHRPVRLSRTLAWHAVRLVALAGGLAAVATSRCGVRRSFVVALEDALAEDDLRPSVWMPPEGDRAVVCGATRKGTIAGFAKVAFAGPARARLERERHALALAGQLPPGSLEAPRLLRAGELDGVDSLVLTAAGGRMGLAPWRLDRRRVEALVSLVRADRHRSLADLLRLEIPDRQPWASLAGRAHEALGPWLDRELPVAFVHGDFTPWNVMDRGDGVVAVDWEDAEPEGIPFWDAWHFATQATTLAGVGSAERLVRAALGGGGTLRHALDGYADGAGLSPSLAGPIFLAYLAKSPETVAKHGGAARADRTAALSFRRRLLERLLLEWR